MLESATFCVFVTLVAISLVASLMSHVMDENYALHRSPVLISGLVGIALASWFWHMGDRTPAIVMLSWALAVHVWCHWYYLHHWSYCEVDLKPARVLLSSLFQRRCSQPSQTEANLLEVERWLQAGRAAAIHDRRVLSGSPAYVALFEGDLAGHVFSATPADHQRFSQMTIGELERLHDEATDPDQRNTIMSYLTTAQSRGPVRLVQ